MGVFTDLTGKKFGRLTVVGQSHRDQFNKIRWKCVCDCGNEAYVITQYLKGGNTRSCGCVHKEEASKRFKKHGSRHTLEYEIWASMIQRCTNERNKRFQDYGGRGIKVCDRWINSFDAFYEDMGPRPSSKLSLERIDNDKGYGPDNCKWATASEQNRNKRARKTSVSGINGVVWNKKHNKWYVYVTVNRKYTYVGCFKNLDVAIAARRKAETIYYEKKPS